MRIPALLLSFLLLLTFAFSLPVFAKAEVDSNDSGIPEIDGDYPDPVNHNVRVRVFVHKAKAKQAAAAIACADPDSTSTTGSAGWKLPSGNWTYNLNPSSVPLSVGAVNLPTIANNGFSQWQSAESTVLLVRGTDTTKTRSSYDRQNIIAWGRANGSALGVTYVRYYTSSGLVVDVDTIMNKKFAWNWNGGDSTTCGNPNTYDAQNILTHEQGHWLGLDDEYDGGFMDNTMFGYGSKGETKKNTLTTGDRAGIAAIYP